MCRLMWVSRQPRRRTDLVGKKQTSGKKNKACNWNHIKKLLSYLSLHHAGRACKTHASSERHGKIKSQIQLKPLVHNVWTQACVCARRRRRRVCLFAGFLRSKPCKSYICTRSSPMCDPFYVPRRQARDSKALSFWNYKPKAVEHGALRRNVERSQALLNFYAEWPFSPQVFCLSCQRKSLSM